MKTVRQSTEKLDFSGDSIYVGIDVHKKQWSVFIMSDYKEHKGFVQPPEPGILGRYLRENFPGATYYSTYEAGFSGFWIHEALKKEGIHNIVVNPADVPTSDKEKKKKSDRVDCRKLCQKLRAKDLDAIYVPDREQLEDRELVRLRTKLVRDIRRCKGRIKSLLNLYGFHYTSSGWNKKFIQWLKELEFQSLNGTFCIRLLVEELERVNELKKQISKQIRAGLLTNEKYSTWLKLLLSVPGIGVVSALVIITELGNTKRFNSFDQLCNYVGIVPTLYSSDEKVQVGHLTPRGNRYVLPVLIQSAWTAAGKDPVLMKSYHLWCKRMKPQEAIIRVTRKLLSRIRYVLIHQTEYQLRTS